MTWQIQLKYLEEKKEWDTAIEFMQDVINEEPKNLKAYLLTIYLLMNLLVEENHDESKHDFYENLLKKYFKESYNLFGNNAEYLFFMGRIAVMSEWYVDLEFEDAEKMLRKSHELEPDNILCKWINFGYLSIENYKNSEIVSYAQLVLQEDSPIKNILSTYGSLGEYVLEMMTGWSKKIVEGKNPYK